MRRAGESPSSLPPASFVGILGHAPSPPAPEPEHSPDSYRGQEGRPAAVVSPASLCLAGQRSLFPERLSVIHSRRRRFGCPQKGFDGVALNKPVALRMGHACLFSWLCLISYNRQYRNDCCGAEDFLGADRRLFHIASFRAVTIARPSERASLPSSIMALRQIECRRRRLGGRDAAGRQTFC